MSTLSDYCYPAEGLNESQRPTEDGWSEVVKRRKSKRVTPDGQAPPMVMQGRWPALPQPGKLKKKILDSSSQHQGSQLQRITSASPISEDVRPPLPAPGRIEKMAKEKMKEPKMVDTEAGHMAVELQMKLLDTSSGFGLHFLQDSQVFPAPSPGLLESNFLFSVLIIPYFQSFRIPAAPRRSQSISASLISKQPCLGGPEPSHPHHQPQHQVCCTLTHSILVLLFLYFQSCLTLVDQQAGPSREGLLVGVQSLDYLHVHRCLQKRGERRWRS